MSKFHTKHYIIL